MPWTVRTASLDDVSAIVHLLDRVRKQQLVAFDLAEAIPELQEPGSTVVACIGSEVVGVLVGRLERDVGRVVAIAIDPGWRHHGIGSSLIEHAERLFLHAGVRRIVALLADGQVGAAALANRGFVATHGLSLYEKFEPLQPTALTRVERWNGELVARSLWESFSGLEQQRDLVEERVLAPLLEPDLAARYGVSAPTTMLLFGPPGTGKTSFAKALAGRLGWPFVELLPSKLGDGGVATMATELHDAFQDLLALDNVVTFIDEVDEIASSRSDRPSTQAVVNELLKAIVRVRESPGRLLVCATNSIRSLDDAVVRPGRFDLVVPIGPPDDDARLAVLKTLLGPIETCSADATTLVEATRGLTPADMAAAVQRAAAARFQIARSSGEQTPLDEGSLRSAFDSCVPTISAANLRDFDDEAERFSR